jgi:hypothetical protein
VQVKKVTTIRRTLRDFGFHFYIIQQAADVKKKKTKKRMVMRTFSGGVQQHFMMTVAAVVFLLSSVAVTTINAQNVTEVLAAFPNYSTFNRLLSATGVIDEVESRNSLTFLLPPNSVLDPFVASHSNLPISEVGDVIRYHILLQYLDATEVQRLNNGSGLVTTLYQTTGRAAGQDGFVNITDEANGDVLVGPVSSSGSTPQVPIITNVTQIPYNYSFFQINGVLVPVGLGAAPPSPPPATAPVPASVAPVPAVVTGTPTLAPTRGPILAPVPTSSVSPTLAPSLVPTSSAAPSPVAVAPVSTTPIAAPVPSSVATPATSPPSTTSGTSTAPVEAPESPQGPSHSGATGASAFQLQSTKGVTFLLTTAISSMAILVFL